MNEKPQNKLFVFTLVMLSLCLLVSAVAANIIQVPNSNVNTIGGITSVNLMLDEAPAGLAGYSINVSVSDPSIATVTDVTFPSWAAMKDNTSFPSPSCKISAVDLNEQINAGATSIPLATLSLKGLKSGSTPLVVTLNRMNNDADGRMYPTVQSSTFTVSVAPVSTQSIIANHTTIKLSTVPKTAIELAKSNLHIAYGHTSHGSQITDGMTGLTTFAGAPYGGELYKWNNGGTDGALDLRDSPFSDASDLGAPDYTTWATATRNYLNTHSDVNVIMWSWCGQADTTAANIDTYLSLMNQLELEYPNVQFVYMTGHLVGTGTNGNLNQRNEQIRAYARANNKILFDFADIESYDPDGLVNFMVLNGDDGCNYNGGNWATAWQNSHTQGVDWYISGAAHTQPLNANMKAYAAWWMWARLGGWDGTPAQIDPVPVITSITPGSATAGDPAFTLTVDGSNFVTGSIIRLEGASRTTTYVSPIRLIAAIPASDVLTAKIVNISVFNPAPGGGLSANTSFVISDPIPKTGNISVTSAPFGASIKLDGTDTGKITPYTFYTQNAGDHTVEVSLAGYKPASKTVTVAFGTTENAEFPLEALPTTGSIAVTSVPVGASIKLDGADTGKITPYTFDTQNAGAHTVEASLAGYKPASKTVTVAVGTTVNAEFQLEALPTTGSIAVTSVPVGAAIKLDGTDTGKITPYTFDNQNAGSHTVEASLAGYKPASKTVTVAVGTIVNAGFPLEVIPTTGSIAVTSVPVGAAIKLDGTDTGKITPYTFDNQNAGSHTVEASLAGYKPASKTVTVAVGTTENAEFLLEPIEKQADLSLTKTVSKSTAIPGEEVTWTITLTNNGPDAARSIIVEDDYSGLSGGAIKSVAQPTMGIVSGTTWTIPILENGQTAKMIAVSSFTTTGKKSNVVRIQSAATPDPVLTNNVASANVTVLEKPASAPKITKVSPASGEVGKTIEKLYITGDKFQQGASVKLQRTGQTDLILTNMVVTDTKRIICTFSIPQNADVGSWDVVVTNPDGQSGVKPGTFSITASKPPQVSHVNPSSGSAGTPDRVLVLYGSDFVDGAKVSLQRSGQSDITAKRSVVFGSYYIIAIVDLPTGAESGQWDVTVTNPDGQRGTKEKSYTIKSVKAPAVRSIEPSTAKAGQMSIVVTIKGSDFVSGASVTLQKISQPDITATNVHLQNSGQLACVFDLPAGAVPGLYDVVVTNPDQKSGKKESGFKITNATVIPTLTPTPKPTKTPTPTITSTKTPTQSPEYPTAQVTGKVDGDKIQLNWNAITDTRLQGYKVVVSKSNANPKYPEDGYMFYITDRNQNHATVDSLTSYNGGDINGKLKSGEKYYFSITAVYGDAKVPGNVVQLVFPGTATVTPTQSPEYPTAQVTGKVDGDKIQLNWNAITDTRLQGYKVVVSKSNANPKYPEDGYMFYITDRNQNHATVDSLTSYNGGDINGKLKSGEKYYFSITAVYGDAKVPGNVVQLVFPGTATPTLTPLITQVPAKSATRMPTPAPTQAPTRVTTHGTRATR